MHFFARNDKQLRQGMPHPIGSQLSLLLKMHNTAHSIMVQCLDYAQVKRHVAKSALDEDGDPVLLNGTELIPLKPNVTPAMQIIFKMFSDGFCGNDLPGQESIRLLFQPTAEARSLHAALYVAHKLLPPGRGTDKRVDLSQLGNIPAEAVTGYATTCDYAADEALSTTGYEALLRRHSANPDEIRLVDIVCSRLHSNAGKCLLGQIMLDEFKRRGSRKKKWLAAIAVSDGGVRLFKSFGFSRGTANGRHPMMLLNLEDIDMEVIRTALPVQGAEAMLGEVCMRKGLRDATRDKLYYNGCR